MNYWPLLGVAVVVAGFALKRNPVLVVVIAGVVSGIAAGMHIGDLLAMLGSAFVNNRMLLLMVMTLPVIGVLERAGLRERARDWIVGFRGLTLTRRRLSRTHPDPVPGQLSRLAPDPVDARPNQRRRTCANRTSAGRADERSGRRTQCRRTQRRRTR